MQRITKDLPATFEIVFVSCTHYGSIFCHEVGIRKLIRYIERKKHRYLVHLGDWIEAITTDDSRYDIETEKGIPQTQAEQVIQVFNPIRKRIITGLRGNHERKLHRISNFSKVICDKLGVQYGTDEARLIITHKGQPFFNVFIAHGSKLFLSNAKDFEQQQANKKAALKLYLQNKMGDCAVMVCGHAHWLAAVPPSNRLYLVDSPQGIQHNYLAGDKGSGGYINPDQRWYGCAGSFYKRYVDGYSSYGLFDPNELGFLTLIVEDGQIIELKEIVV